MFEKNKEDRSITLVIVFLILWIIGGIAYYHKHMNNPKEIENQDYEILN